MANRNGLREVVGCDTLLGKEGKIDKTKRLGKLGGGRSQVADRQKKTAPRESLVPDFLFALVFQRAEGN